MEPSVNLSNSEDRRQILESSQAVPAMHQLLVGHLEDYLRLFKWPEFHTIYQGGLLSIPGPNNVQFAFQFEPFLRLTDPLTRLEQYSGFSSLIEGFRNPTQINATLFEVQVAAWCSTRKVTQSIEFSPQVHVGGSIKRPEFLWRTSLGDIYCECKQENSVDNKATKRVQKLFELVGKAYDANGPWDESLRLDMIVGHPARDGVNQIIKRLVGEAASRQRDGRWEGEIVNGVVTLKLAKKTDDVPNVTGCAQFHNKELKGGPEPILSTNSRYTLTMSVMGHRLQRLVELVRDARTQLPQNHPAAIFIDIGGSQVFVDKLNELIAQSSYANIAWISLWEKGQFLKPVIRGGQPLDARLAEGI
jgi:hypothetical protein